MKYQEFAPGETLKPYVKCFYTCEYEMNVVVQDKAFATGCIELMFNLGEGIFETGHDANFTRTPKAELWGQIVKPMDFRSLGKGKMLGIRFYPHTASLFLDDPISLFNDSVSDFLDVAGAEAMTLHARLLDTSVLTDQLALLEIFLTRRLYRYQKKQHKFNLVSNVIADVKQDDFYENINDIAFKYGISARYLQKLFSEFTGLTPKLYHKISRFQKSLLLTAQGKESLTSVAYLSGYFDQSHFVRDFKTFTGMSPSAFTAENSTVLLPSSKEI